MLIKNGQIVDVLEEKIFNGDIRIKDGLIEDIGKNLQAGKEKVIDADNLVVSPGFIDVHVHFRDPGNGNAEDISSGARAAAAGGFTSVLCMGNTSPAMDTKESIDSFYKKANKENISIYTVGNLTCSLADEDLSDLDALKEAGIVAISDDGSPNMNTGLILKGLLKAKDLGLTVAFHEEDPSLIYQAGINHEKAVEKGFKGAMSLAEDVLVAREGALALKTGARVLIQHLSSKNSVSILRSFKELGADIHGEVTPHHFSSNQDLVDEKGSLAKMNPPLRTEGDRLELIKGLQDGTIEIIASDHAPHTSMAKDQAFKDAPSGIIGLETSLGLGMKYLVEPGHLSLIEYLKKMTINPARIIGLDAGTIEIGKQADLTIFDPGEKCLVEDKFKSKSNNSPYIGEELIGKVKYTITKGNIVYKDGK